MSEDDIRFRANLKRPAARRINTVCNVLTAPLWVPCVLAAFVTGVLNAIVETALEKSHEWIDAFKWRVFDAYCKRFPLP